MTPTTQSCLPTPSSRSSPSSTSVDDDHTISSSVTDVLEPDSSAGPLCRPQRQVGRIRHRTTELLLSRLVSDLLWFAIEPEVIAASPQYIRRPQGGGRSRCVYQDAFVAVVYVLASGCSWHQFPEEMFTVSKSTAYRRSVDWRNAGLWERLVAVSATWPCASDREWIADLAQAARVRAQWDNRAHAV